MMGRDLSQDHSAFVCESCMNRVIPLIGISIDSIYYKKYLHEKTIQGF